MEATAPTASLTQADVCIIGAGRVINMETREVVFNGTWAQAVAYFDGLPAATVEQALAAKHHNNATAALAARAAR